MMSELPEATFFPAQEHPIARVGIVVRDAAATAKNYSEILDLGPWSFSDLEPTATTLQGRPQTGAQLGVRVAANTIGDKQIELLQPLHGPSPYRTFLDRRGEGVHHLAFAPTHHYADLVTRAPTHGLTVEMEAVWPGGQRRLQLGPWEELGVLFEFSDTATGGPTPWGYYRPARPGWIGAEDKRIAQIGIVTGDSEALAQRYHALFGIGPWVFYDFKPPVGGARVLHDVAVEPGIDHLIKAAIADHTNLQFEFLQPVTGPSTHLEYWHDLGVGAHHLSFDIVDDHDEIVAAAPEHAIGIEMAGMAGDAFLYTYLATREQLGTFWEILKFFPEEDTMSGAYGVYPPEETGT